MTNERQNPGDYRRVRILRINQDMLLELIGLYCKDANVLPPRSEVVSLHENHQCSSLDALVYNIEFSPVENGEPIPVLGQQEEESDKRQIEDRIALDAILAASRNGDVQCVHALVEEQIQIRVARGQESLIDASFDHWLKHRRKSGILPAELAGVEQTEAERKAETEGDRMMDFFKGG